VRAVRAKLNLLACLRFGFFFACSFSLSAADSASEFRGDGLCRFALKRYALPKDNEDKINFIVGDLLRRHEEAFNFTASPDFACAHPHLRDV